MRLSTASIGIGAAVWLAAAVSLAAAGCGGNSTEAAQTGDGGDSGGDASNDGSLPESSQEDSPTADQSVDAPNDTTTDSSNDVTMLPEASTDAAADASDSGADAADATPDSSVVDAAPDGPTLVEQEELAFAEQESNAICTWELGCCPGGLGSGTYNLPACVSLFNGYGWEANQPQQFTFNRGYIAFNATQAATCLSTIKNLPCGTQTAAQWGAVTNACELVLYGTIPANQSGCLNSFECASGTYCAAPGDGGVGVCTPLATQDQPCDTAINSPDDTIPDYMCSYLGSGNTGLYCDLIDPQGSAKYATCQPLLSTSGASCVNGTSGYEDDQACSAASGGALCGDLGCGTTASYPYPGFCSIFTIKD
jgi:hypothetical protein